jgi:hypothetical protein
VGLDAALAVGHNLSELTKARSGAGTVRVGQHHQGGFGASKLDAASRRPFLWRPGGFAGSV